MLGAVSSLITFSYTLITLWRRGSASVRPSEGVEMQSKGGDQSKRSSVASISSMTSEGVYSTHPLYLLRVPFFFFLVFFTIYVYMFGYRLYGYKHYDGIMHGFEDWAVCAFSYYDGTDAWKGVCGDHGYDQIPYNNMFVYYIIPSLLPILFGTIMLLGRQNFYEFALLGSNSGNKFIATTNVLSIKTSMKNVQPIEVASSPLHKKGGSNKIQPV
jgi:hypothetical protein